MGEYEAVPVVHEAELERLRANNGRLRKAMAALIEPAEASTWHLNMDDPDDRPTWEETWQAIEDARALLKDPANG